MRLRFRVRKASSARRGTIRPVIVLEALLVLAVLCAVAAVAAGRGDMLADASRDGPDSGLPADRPLRPEDVGELRFGMALRGYRMAEVDAALARLTAELADRDARIAQLEESADAGPAPPVPAASADRLDPGHPAS